MLTPCIFFVSSLSTIAKSLHHKIIPSTKAASLDQVLTSLFLQNSGTKILIRNQLAYQAQFVVPATFQYILFHQLSVMTLLSYLAYLTKPATV